MFNGFLRDVNMWGGGGLEKYEPCDNADPINILCRALRVHFDV